MTRARKRDHNLLTNAVSLLVCGLLAGVVVAAAAFPVVAMSGLAAKAGAETFDKLPSELKDQRAPQLSRIYASDRKTLMATIFDEFRNDVPLADISKNMQDAIIAAEDKGFRSHNGIDPKGILRAFVANKSSGSTQQGASTLTMQYVRMSIAYSATHPEDVVAATVDTPARKAREARMAVQVSKELTKDQVLERYLNIAPFGNGAYGVYAASQVYFGKRPKDLTVAEAALLAGLVKAPTDFNPATTKGHPEAVGRRNYVIDQMVITKAITPEQAAEAKKVEISHEVQRASNGCTQVPNNNWGFPCDYFVRWWNSQEQFGASTYDREQRLKTGGYTIVTSFDLGIQDAARKNVADQIKDDKSRAIMVGAIEPGTGYVRAMATNRVFKLDDGSNGPSTNPDRKGQRGSYPNTTNPLISGGGDISGYQAGSTFKIFPLVAALEKGYPLSYTINAQAKYISGFAGSPSDSSTCDGKHYCVTNSIPSMAGPANMWSAFGRSVNTFFVPLEERVGVRATVDMAQKLGIRFLDSDDAKQAKENPGWGAFTLGVSHTTPVDLANAYATLAADGMHCEPLPVEEIQDHGGAKLDMANPRCNRAVSEDVARAAVDAARCPLGDSSQFGKCSTSGTAPGVRGTVKHHVFGKTGTTDDDRTATLVAGTMQLVVAGIMGDPDNTNGGHNSEHSKVNPAVYNTLRDAMKDQPNKQFPKPSEKIVYGDQRSIPDVKCKSPGDAQARLEDAGFEVDRANSKIDSPCPAGTVAGTDPDGRTIKGGVVMLQISNGNGSGTPQPGQPGQPGIITPNLPGGNGGGRGPN